MNKAFSWKKGNIIDQMRLGRFARDSRVVGFDSFDYASTEKLLPAFQPYLSLHLQIQCLHS